MLLVGAADDLAVGAFGDLDDLALGPALAVDADDAGDGVVAVQHLVHLLGRQEQVGAAFVRHEEAEAVRMPLDATADEVGLVRDQPVAAAVLQQLRRARHGAEPALEVLMLEVLDVEQFAQALERNGHALLAERLEDVFAARQRGVVFGGFALEHRIGAAYLGVLGGFVV